MLAERNKQRNLMKLLEPEKGKGGIKCYSCGEGGHLSKDCSKNKAKGKVSKSVNACVKVAPIPCPGCNGQHSFQSKGETLYKTYLSACETFRSMTVAERARIVESQRHVNCVLIGQPHTIGIIAKLLLKEDNLIETVKLKITV